MFTSITELPNELFYKICYNLSATDILNLRKVCKIFRELIDQISFQKKLFHDIYLPNIKFLPSKPFSLMYYLDQKQNYLKICNSIENRKKIFNDSSCYKCFRAFASVCIDSIHIHKKYPKLFFTGDRNRCLSVYNLETVYRQNSKKPMILNSSSHQGWVWCFSSYEDSLISGSWDSYLNYWSVDAERIDKIKSYKLDTAVLSCGYLSNDIALAGTFQKSIYLIDFRAPNNEVRIANRFHNQSILCLETVPTSSEVNLDQISLDKNSNLLNSLESFQSELTNEEFSSLNDVIERSVSDISLFSEDEDVFSDQFSQDLKDTKIQPLEENAEDVVFSHPMPGLTFFSGSRDKSICQWDLRKLNIPVVKHMFRLYPRFVSLVSSEQLWVAEPPGLIHLFDIRNKTHQKDCLTEAFPQMNLIGTGALENFKKGFGGLKATQDCLIVNGLNGTVNMFYPGLPLRPYKKSTILSGLQFPPISVDSNRSTTVVGSTGGDIHIWTDVNSLLT